MKSLLCCLLFVTLASAYVVPYYYGNYLGNYWPGYPFAHPWQVGGTYLFYGVYPGSCAADGFYYHDDRSFVICSNGVAHVRPCPRGTRNSALSHFNYGAYYGYSDFCDINVNDIGIRD